MSVNNTQQNETLPEATHESSCMERQCILSHIILSFALRDEVRYHKEATAVMRVIGRLSSSAFIYATETETYGQYEQSVI